MVTLMPWEWLFTPDDRVWTASDLNANPSRSVGSSLEAYWTSKALARAAVKDFIKHQKPHFETIQLLPGVIIGRDERAASVADLRRDTPQWALRMAPILGGNQSDGMASVPVDVEDVATAHVDAIKDTVPGNTDYTLSTGPTADIVWDVMIEVAKKYFPEKVGSKEMPLGGTLPTMKWLVDMTDTEEAYGWKFRPFEETLKDMIGQYLELSDNKD
jgi:nucleoside-diphosphate-sugar epimerase